MTPQDLKKAFFESEEKIFTRKYKFDTCHNVKDITSVFTRLANQPQYSEVRKRYKIDKIISKILLPSQLHYVLYSFYRNKKLIIATPNHVGQSELNLQKMTLIKYLKQIKEYEDIQEVSIFRDESFVSLKHEEQKELSSMTFHERSYGIFENDIQDNKISKIIESIREIIKNSNQDHDEH